MYCVGTRLIEWYIRSSASLLLERAYDDTDYFVWRRFVRVVGACSVE
jgi:hypothetical protein